MEGFFAAIQTFFVCGTALVLAFVVLVSLPQSKLREFLVPIMAGIAAFRTAMKAKKED